MSPYQRLSCSENVKIIYLNHVSIKNDLVEERSYSIFYQFKVKPNRKHFYIVQQSHILIGEPILWKTEVSKSFQGQVGNQETCLCM